MKTKKTLPDKIYYALIAAAVVFIVLVLWKKGTLDPAAGFMAKTSNAFSSYVYYVKGSFKSIKYVSAARTGINALKERNIILETENASLRYENNKLKRLLELKENKKFRGHIKGYADVIGANTDVFIQYYVIGKGANDGVKEGDGIIARGKAFGRVQKVFSSSSRIQLITDIKSSVSAGILRNDIAGILAGTGVNECSLKYVPKEEDVKTGDVVITSGLGSSFPGGIEIGRVAAVNKNTDGLSMEVEVRPFVDQFSVREVLILKKQR
ncbi:MAG: rod shape-determining protein MreC [bacterium]